MHTQKQAKVKFTTRASRIQHSHYRHCHHHHHLLQMGKNWILCSALCDEQHLCANKKQQINIFSIWKLVFHLVCFYRRVRLVRLFVFFINWSQFSIHIALLVCTIAVASAGCLLNFLIIDSNNNNTKVNIVQFLCRSDFLQLDCLIHIIATHSIASPWEMRTHDV